MGSFVLEQSSSILEAIADILPPGSPQLLSAKAALQAAADITRKVDPQAVRRRAG